MKRMLLTALFTLNLASALTLTKEQNQQDFNVKVGEEITLTLPENPSTGYRWFTLEQDKTIALTSSKYVQNAQSSKTSPMMTGVGGNKIYRFKAKKLGQTAIQLVRLPPGRNREVAELVQFYINVAK